MANENQSPVEKAMAQIREIAGSLPEEDREEFVEELAAFSSDLTLGDDDDFDDDEDEEFFDDDDDYIPEFGE